MLNAAFCASCPSQFVSSGFVLLQNVERSFPEFLAAPKASKVERVDKLFDSISNADLHHVSAVQNEIDDLREQLSNKNKGATAPDADPR